MKKYSKELLKKVSKLTNAEQWKEFFNVPQKDNYIDYFFENVLDSLLKNYNENDDSTENNSTAQLFQQTVLSDKHLIVYLDKIQNNNIDIYPYILNKNQPLSTEIINKYLKSNYPNFLYFMSSFTKMDIDFVNKNILSFHYSEFKIENYPNIDKEKYLSYVKQNIKHFQFFIKYDILTDEQLIELSKLDNNSYETNHLLSDIIKSKNYDTDFLLKILNTENISKFYFIKKFNITIYKKFNKEILDLIKKYGISDISFDNNKNDKPLINLFNSLNLINRTISNIEYEKDGLNYMMSNSLMFHSLNKGRRKKEKILTKEVKDYYKEFDSLNTKYKAIYKKRLENLQKEKKEHLNKIKTILNS